MSIGFVHGVMNTDNMTVSGETIDYGPCAFMDGYDPNIYYSSIDKYGRYSYKNQPAILIWNLTKLAETFIPLVNENIDKAVKDLSEVLNLAMPTYEEYFYTEMSIKLGIKDVNEKIIRLIDKYLDILKTENIDYTISFRDLSMIHSNKIKVSESIFKRIKVFEKWYEDFSNTVNIKNVPKDIVSEHMDGYNPCYIPRNYIIENALKEAINGNMSEIEMMNEYLKMPYKKQKIHSRYYFSSDYSQPYTTFCGT